MADYLTRKRCGDCGAVIPDIGNFCPKCGSGNITMESVEAVPVSANIADPVAAKPSKNKKPKKWPFVAGGVLLALFATGVVILLTVCFHEWQPATCLKPSTCSECGEEKGEPLGHTWNNATCTEDQKCHTCGAIGEKAKGHTPSETWEITKEAKINSEGEKIKKCTVCSEVVETTKFSLTSYYDKDGFIFTPEEFKAIYKDKLGEWSSSLSFKLIEDDDQEVNGIVSYNSTPIGIVLFSSDKDGGEPYVHYQYKGTNTAKSVGCGFDISGNSTALAYAMVAFIQSCDMDISATDALDCASDMVKKADYGYGIVYKNGINYEVMLEDEMLIVSALIKDYSVDV